MGKVREALEFYSKELLDVLDAGVSDDDVSERARDALPELEAMEAVIESARRAEAIYWNFEKSMRAEMEDLRGALQALDAARQGKT